MRIRRTKALIILFVTLILICIFVPGFKELHGLLARRGELKRKSEQLRESNLKLEMEKERLTEDPVYIEKMMRQKLGVRRPDETIYRVRGRGQF